MKFREYVEAVLNRLDQAADKGDNAECVRLLRVLRDECESQAAKLSEVKP